MASKNGISRNDLHNARLNKESEKIISGLLVKTLKMFTKKITLIGRYDPPSENSYTLTIKEEKTSKAGGYKKFVISISSPSGGDIVQVVTTLTAYELYNKFRHMWEAEDYVMKIITTNWMKADPVKTEEVKESSLCFA